MEVIQQFDFATIVCDGCARRVDSHVDDEWMRDYAELIECYLPDAGWEPQDKDEEKWLCPECVKDESRRKHPGEGRIIVEPEPLYGLKCDLCGKTFENFEGYSCWREECETHEAAREDEWMEIDGKWYCPDCYCTCPAIKDDEMDWDEAKKRYCAKCPYEKDCNEVVPLDKPEPSSECEYAFKGEDGKWKRCPHYEKDSNGNRIPHTCCLHANGGKECPRVAYWRDTGKSEQEAKNAKVLEECHLKEEDV